MKFLNLFFLTLFFALTVSAQVTTSDSIQIGKPGSSANKEIKFGAGRGAKPGIRYNTTNSKLEFSNDANIFKALGSGSGSGAGINLLDNPGFEDGITSNWASSGTSLVSVTSGVNLLFELITASWTPTAAGHYFESSAVVVPNGLYGEACMVQTYYQGGDANAYLTVFKDGVEYIPSSARAVLNSTAGVKKATVYFDCPSSGSIKIRVQATAAMVTGYFDKAHMGQADFVQSKQSSYVGGLIWTNQAGCIWQGTSTSFSNFAAQASCPNPTVVGNVSAPPTKVPAVLIPVAKKGTYYFVSTGLFQKLSGTDSIIQFRFSDGTNHSNSNVIRNNTSFHGVPNILGTITLSSDTSNWLVNMQAITGNVSVAYGIENIYTGQALEIQVYFFPSGTDTVVNSKCLNDIQCENEFSANVSISGVVSGENLDWINGNCSATSPYTCNFNSGIFSTGPNCTFTNINDGGGYLTAIPTSSSFTYRTILTTNGATTNLAFQVKCSKNSSDFKARQTIQGFFTNEVTSSQPLTRVEFVKFSGGGATNCTTTPCTINFSSPAVSSVTRSSAGQYAVNFNPGTWPNTNYMCTGSCVRQGVTQDCVISSNATSNTNLGITTVVSGSANDAEVQVQCVGQR